MCIVELLFQTICKFRRSITQFTLGRLSQQAARRAAFSSTEQNSHFRHAVGGFPKPTPSPAEHPVLAQGALAPLPLPFTITLTPRCDLHCLAGIAGQLTRAQCGFRRVISLDLGTSVCLCFLGVNTQFTCLLNDIFPMQLDGTGTAQSFLAILGFFIFFLEFPYRSSFLHFLLRTSSSHQLVLFISFWKPLSLPI